MKRLNLHAIGLALILTGAFTVSAEAQFINFDNATTNGTGTRINMGYSGFDWSNFYLINTEVLYSIYGYYPNDGFINNIVSLPNIAFNGYGNPATISSGLPFTLTSAYLGSGQWDDNQVDIQGYNGATLVYDNTYTVSTEGPAIFETFNYVDVTSVTFTTSDGIFTMDELSINGAAPEPSQYGLFIAIAVTGLVAARRFRTD